MRRAALGGVRAAGRHRADRRRRGARRLLQARGRSALRRARGGASGAPEQHGAVLLAGSATPRPESVRRAARACACPDRDRRPAAAAGRGARHARPAPSAAPRHADGAGRRARAGAQGDRAAQPARLVELPLLPRLRAGVDVPELRGRAGPAPRPGLPGLPPLRAPPPGAEPLRGLRLGRRRPSRRGHREPRAGAARGVRRRASRSSASTPTPPPARDAWPRRWPRFEAAPAGVLVGTQMVAKGHDFADVALGVVLDADQTLRFPDFRAEERTFALLTQLAGRVGRGRAPAAACSSRRSRRTRASIALAARHDADGFLAVELDAARGARLPAVRHADPHRVRLARAPATRGAGHPPARPDRPVGRHRARSGPAVPAARPLAQPAGHQVPGTAGRRSRAVGAAVDACAADAVRRGVSVSVDPDPQ